MSNSGGQQHELAVEALGPGDGFFIEVIAEALRLVVGLDKAGQRQVHLVEAGRPPTSLGRPLRWPSIFKQWPVLRWQLPVISHSPRNCLAACLVKTSNVACGAPRDLGIQLLNIVFSYEHVACYIRVIAQKVMLDGMDPCKR